MTNVSIGFVLLSSSRHPIPSTRISVLNVFPYLRAAGFDPQIAFEPNQGSETPQLPANFVTHLISERFKIVYFQKVHGQDVENLAKSLRAQGIRTVYGVCDLVQETMAALTDATIVVTDYLKSLYSKTLWPKMHVVHDGIEHPDIEITQYRDSHGSSTNPLRAVLVTSAALDHLPVLTTPPPWLEIAIVGLYTPEQQYIKRLRQTSWAFQRQHGWRERLAYLRFVANPRVKLISWDPTGVYEQLRQADIGIIPIDMLPPDAQNTPVPSWKVKSENRLTMKMSVGLPVIATPIPSYEPVIQHGLNGFFARSRTDWMEYLEALRDPQLRKTIGMAARNSVIDNYSMQKQAEKMIRVFNGLL